MDESGFRKLNSAVEHLIADESFSATVEKLDRELEESTDTFVWSSVDLESIHVDLPDAIKSAWIFHLKQGLPSGAHYHPNSIQHMVVVSGRGTADIGGVRRVVIPFSSSASLEDKWLVIDEGVPHEFTPEGGPMTVVSFHTCHADELEEIECDSGAARHYEGLR